MGRPYPRSRLREFQTQISVVPYDGDTRAAAPTESRRDTPRVAAARATANAAGRPPSRPPPRHCERYSSRGAVARSRRRETARSRSGLSGLPRIGDMPIMANANDESRETERQRSGAVGCGSRCARHTSTTRDGRHGHGEARAAESRHRRTM
eukprot:3200224-Prymnesium_polylepis.1